MINYDPLWKTMQKKNVTKYQLIYHWGMSSNTLRRISHNGAISTTTLNELCLILDCKVQDIIKFEASEEEIEDIKEQKAEIEAKKNRKKNKKNKPKTSS